MSTAQRPHCYLTPFSIKGRIGRQQPLGLPVINMAYNELPFAPTEAVTTAIAETGARANRYGDPRCAALQAQISQRFDVDANTIVCGNGSEELLDVIARNFIQPGDQIVMSSFGYIQFELIANRLNADLLKAPEVDYTANVDMLLDAVSDKTRLLFLANPNNPTGTLMPETEIRRLLDALPKQIVLVLDLAYGEFVDPDYCARMHVLVGQHNNLVVTRTFSKAFALAGLRVGWCHAPAWMIPGFYAARGMGTVNAVAQAAAIAGLTELDRVSEQVAMIVAERERMVSRLRDIGVRPIHSQANFILMTIDGAGAEQIESLVEYLFDTTGILVTWSREGGLENFLRVSVSLPEHNDALMHCISTFPGLHAGFCTGEKPDD